MKCIIIDNDNTIFCLSSIIHRSFVIRHFLNVKICQVFWSCTNRDIYFKNMYSCIECENVTQLLLKDCGNKIVEMLSLRNLYLLQGVTFVTNECYCFENTLELIYFVAQNWALHSWLRVTLIVIVSYIVEFECFYLQKACTYIVVFYLRELG